MRQLEGWRRPRWLRPEAWRHPPDPNRRYSMKLYSSSRDSLEEWRIWLEPEDENSIGNSILWLNHFFHHLVDKYKGTEPYLMREEVGGGDAGADRGKSLTERADARNRATEGKERDNDRGCDGYKGYGKQDG